jgi:hypothetical protein
MKGKITVELEYQLNEDGDRLLFRHPDLEHVLSLPYTGERLMNAQLEALQLTEPKSDIDRIMEDGREFMATASSLKPVFADILAAFSSPAPRVTKGKTNSGGPN